MISPCSFVSYIVVFVFSIHESHLTQLYPFQLSNQGRYFGALCIKLFLVWDICGLHFLERIQMCCSTCKFIYLEWQAGHCCFVIVTFSFSSSLFRYFSRLTCCVSWVIHKLDYCTSVVISLLFVSRATVLISISSGFVLFVLLQRSFLCFFEMVESFWAYFDHLISLVHDISIANFGFNFNISQITKEIFISQMQQMLF